LRLASVRGRLDSSFRVIMVTETGVSAMIFRKN